MIKKYQEFNESLLKEYKIKFLCKKYGIKNYSINKDYSIDINGDVDLSHIKFGLYFKKLTHIPLNFNIVEGCFNCSYNNLTTLEGCPNEIGWFDCSHNNLYKLKGCPKKIGVNEVDLRKNPIEEIINIFPDMLGNNIEYKMQTRRKILEAWDLYEPVRNVNGQWTIFEHRLEELYTDVTGLSARGEYSSILKPGKFFHEEGKSEFKNYIIDRS
jgi:hypothetical protein